MPKGGAALLVVDCQHDFLQGSCMYTQEAYTVAVPGALKILPDIVRIIQEHKWDLVVATQDYHPPNHISFASRHGVEPFQLCEVPHPFFPDSVKVSQMMWPVHCVQETHGAELDSTVRAALDAKEASGTPVHYVKKGEDSNFDSYSAFASNEYILFTELTSLLFGAQPHAISTVVVVGLATDYCVMSTAVDAAKFGLRTLVPKDCVRGVESTTTEQAIEKMQVYGCEIFETREALLAAI